MADKSFIVVNEEENKLFDQDDLIVFSAVRCFMRCVLNRIKGYFEVTVPIYAPSEFLNDEAILSWAEKLSRQKGFQWVKQVLVFLWLMANEEPARLVADININITTSRVDTVLHRGT